MEETQALGERLGKLLSAGDVLGLEGDLGAGKTCFVQGLARGLGVDPTRRIGSPTFTLVHEYAGTQFPIYHFDFYRLKVAAEATQYGLDDYLFGEGVSLIEWADRFPELLPPRTRWVHLASTSESSRSIRIDPAQ